MGLHAYRLRLVLLLLSFTGLAAAAASAKTYSAERFDSQVRVLPGGDIEVTETVVFRFEEGTFTYVFRDIPRRRTDGVDVLRVSMDGREMPFGDDPGEVEIRERSQVRVRWHFPGPVSSEARTGEGAPRHTFTLTYRVRGAVREGEDADLLAWRAIPGKHDYTIERATVEMSHPAALAAAPGVETRRVKGFQVSDRGTSVRVEAQNIGKNGWVETWLSFPTGSIMSTPPAWQLAERRADALAPRWIGAAALILAGGLLLFWSLRQRYDAPSHEPPLPSLPGVPDDLPPAVAGALAANGRVSHALAMATLFSLADRGAIVIRQEPRRPLGQQEFTLERQPVRGSLRRHEQTALDLAFSTNDRPEHTVTLSKARSRLASGARRFRAVLHDDMHAAGLIDRDRQAIYQRMGAVSIGALVLGALLMAGAAFLIPEYRAWPLLLPAAVMVVGVIGFIFQGATTLLSNEGVRRAARWRAYQRHLRQVADREVHLAHDSPAGVLSFAVALGLASAWAKFVKSHPVAVPSWFSAVSASDTDGFPAFLAYTASSGGGGVSASGAAGGGASGAG